MASGGRKMLALILCASLPALAVSVCTNFGATSKSTGSPLLGGGSTAFAASSAPLLARRGVSAHREPLVPPSSLACGQSLFLSSHGARAGLGGQASEASSLGFRSNLVPELKTVSNVGAGRASPLGLSMNVALPGPRTERKANHIGHKVLVLNASFEPLSVITASRALTLMWDEKAMMIIPHDKVWTSCSGEKVEVPSVVCLRRFVKVHPKYPVVNRRMVLMRDKGCCQYCGGLAENVDHVVPRSRGGQNVWTNVVASCAKCNNKKADKMLKDLDMKLKRQPAYPSAVSWVHSAVWKVDPRWKPYVGDMCWSDIETMWKGTKMDPKRKQRKSGKKSSGGGGGKNAKAKAKKGGRKVSQKEVDQVVSAYSPVENGKVTQDEDGGAA